MSIKVADVKVGREYKTGNNQDRVVLGRAKNGRSKIVYASRGGNVKNDYCQRYVCENERFAKACDKIEKKLPAKKLKEIIKKTNASSLIR